MNDLLLGVLIWLGGGLAWLIGGLFAAWLVSENMPRMPVLLLFGGALGVSTFPGVTASLLQLAPAGALATRLARLCVLGAAEVAVAAPLAAAISYHRLVPIWSACGDGLQAAGGGRWRLPFRLRRLETDGGALAMGVGAARIALELAVLALMAGHFGAPVPAVLQSVLGQSGPAQADRLQAFALHMLRTASLFAVLGFVAPFYARHARSG